MRQPVFVDTNLLVYLYDNRDAQKYRSIQMVLEPLFRTQQAVISSQVVQEFCSVALKKLHMPVRDVQEILATVLTPLVAHTSSPEFYRRAVQLYEHYQLSFYDALIVQAALDLDCRTLYSEDLQAGAKYNTLTVINPFAL